ncbi:NUDIX hydrolase [Oceanobacillus picturae]|uniref:NUDIX hydrolase n=1 Tax=Oceanobacillus picturae TaxID=171693 RepID=UPI000E681B20|nr:NUDIX hydrolase [Oceanobacillus picturae]RIU92037.1 NUDIX domain-containing protein [Oceanobacillus picturae]
MSQIKKFHRAFGVYGIYIEDNKLLVINKSRGPYKNRYDLPGGSLEEGEGLSIAMQREFKEETGIDIEILKNLGAIDFIAPWNWKGFTHVHHIAVYYEVKRIGGKIIKPAQFEGQDSLGAVWVTKEEVSLDNASPLVLKAFEWINKNELGIETVCYDQWEVKENI